MASFLSEISVALQIIQRLYDLNDAAEGNTERCRLLNNRCQCFKPALQRLWDDESQRGKVDDLMLPISSLCETLQECENFMIKYCQKGWKRACLNFANAKSIEASFNSLNTRLMQSSSDLHLLISVFDRTTIKGTNDAADEVAAAQRADEDKIMTALQEFMHTFEGSRSLNNEMQQEANMNISNFAQSIEERISRFSDAVGSSTFKLRLDQLTALLETVHCSAFSGVTNATPTSPSAMQHINKLSNTAVSTSSTMSTTSNSSSSGGSLTVDTTLSYAALVLELLEFDISTAVKLGEGSFGAVYRGNYENEPVAIKYFGNIAQLSDTEVRIIKREAAIMRLVNHPFIAGMRGFNLSKGILVMELAHASLFDVLHRVEALRSDGSVPRILLECCQSRTTQCLICLQLASALRYLHFCDILHRDIKPRNVLLVVSDDQRKVTVKLGDFGIAVALSKTGLGSTGKLHANSKKGPTGAAGTYMYKAPELVDIDVDFPTHTTATDVFAFAVTMNEVLSTEQPWTKAGDTLGEMQVAMRLMAGKRPDLFTTKDHKAAGVEVIEPAEVDGDLVSLITSCWEQDASNRWNISTAAVKLQAIVSTIEQLSQDTSSSSNERVDAVGVVSDTDVKEQTQSSIDGEGDCSKDIPTSAFLKSSTSRPKQFVYDGRDVPTVVIDNGSSEIKAGFSDDDQFAVNVPTCVGRSRSLQSHNTQRDECIGHDAVSNMQSLTLNYPLQRGVVKDWDDMEKIWWHTFSELGVNPESHTIFLTEPILNPNSHSERMTLKMFETFNVPSMLLHVSAPLAMFGVGEQTGVVIDSGDGVTQVVPVIDCYANQHAIKRLNLAGYDITEYLLQSLIDKRGSCPTAVERKYAKEMKEAISYVAFDLDDEFRNPGGDPSKVETKYTLPDSSVITVGNERFLCAEALFGMLDTPGIHELVMDSVKMCNHFWRDLMSSIYLSGGNTLFPGIADRLRRELSSRQQYSHKIKVIDRPNRKYFVWDGASLMASISTVQESAITKADYDEFGQSIVHRKRVDAKVWK